MRGCVAKNSRKAVHFYALNAKTHNFLISVYKDLKRDSENSEFLDLLFSVLSTAILINPIGHWSVSFGPYPCLYSRTGSLLACPGIVPRSDTGYRVCSRLDSDHIWAHPTLKGTHTCSCLASSHKFLWMR